MISEVGEVSDVPPCCFLASFLFFPRTRKRRRREDEGIQALNHSAGHTE